MHMGPFCDSKIIKIYIYKGGGGGDLPPLPDFFSVMHLKE